MNKLTQTLDDLLSYAVKNRHSDFYRTHYKDVSVPEKILTLSDWEQIPPLSKADILAVPFWKRIFTPPAGVDTVRNTSGTTGGNVLLIPRSKFTDYSYFPKDVSVTGVLTFLATQHIYERQTHLLWPNAQSVTGNAAHLEHSVKLAAHANVNVIQSYVFMMEALIPLLEKYKLAEKIELIEFMGERVTPSMWKKVKAHMPNATIIADYGSSEYQSVAAVAYPEENPERAFYYHSQPTHLIEFLDPDSGAAVSDPGSEGEITITTLWSEDNPFPLIRYRSGDLGRIVQTSQDPMECTFEVLGRLTLDRIKIAGGEIKVEEVERVLRDLHDRIGEEFELHFYEEGGKDGLPSVTLKLVPHQRDCDMTVLAEDIKERLRVAPTYTYKDGVENAIYGPLTCEAYHPDPKQKKTVRFFRHEA